jgi:hypothetical protein
MSLLASPSSAVFEWHPEPRAAAFVGAALQDSVARSSSLQRLQERLRDETGTRLADWLDQITLPADIATRTALVEAGFLEVTAHDGQHYWQHPGGLFPLLQLRDALTTQLFLRVDSLEDFLRMQRCDAVIAEAPGALIRQARAFAEAGVELWAREKHGSVLEATRSVAVEALRLHREAFARRPREGDVGVGFAAARELIAAAQHELGNSYTCDLFFAAERQFWLARNRAGQLQKQRQDALGLGFGNHDHHTYRSSREHFKALVETLELLGLHCRERFYAGRQAGWGAQVMEHSALGVAVFADVDLSPEEVAGDFAHSGLTAQEKLGTIGLWCRLHGEALLAAGMHHLECQFDFDAVSTQLGQLGVGRMKPFTDFSYLRQAFTTGELWPVPEERIAALEQSGNLSSEQARSIRERGALGSHLEILERNDGYKGFNQTGISDIILRTDPRAVA